MTTAKDLFAVLQRKAGFEAVSHTPSATRLRVMGRLPIDRAGMNMANWKVLMDRLFVAMERGRPWTVDISKMYFRKGGKLVYAWRLLFQGDNIEGHFKDIINVIQTSPGAARPEPEEVKLYGRQSNDTSGGKRGAQPVLSAVVGPMAAARKNMGG
jgi:hypothetical protein